MNQLRYYVTAIIGLCIFSNFIFPWWITAIVSAICSFVFKIKKWLAVTIAFTSIFTVWSGLSLFHYLNSARNITDMISLIFSNVGSNTLILITGFVGGITAALGSWVGVNLRMNYKNA
ncbi:MAG: hypothetical protein IT267_01065 [Saprospiraceae bacterium]|nr:hypothetical protein [Saprospiraceae bacterium]